MLNIMVPDDPLNRFVAEFIYFTDLHHPNSKEVYLPNGRVELIIDLTDTPKNLYDNEDYRIRTSFRRGWISGLRNRHITIDAGQKASMFVIAFRPGGAFPFLPCPANTVTNKVIPLEDLWGNDFRILRDQLLESDTPETCFAVAEDFLLKLLKPQRDINPGITHATDQLIRMPAISTIERLANNTGYSHKHFIDLFRRQVGIPPQTVCRAFSISAPAGRDKKPTAYQLGSSGIGLRLL